jgi:hypothetical protein
MAVGATPRATKEVEGWNPSTDATKSAPYSEDRITILSFSNSEATEFLGSLSLSKDLLISKIYMWYAIRSPEVLRTVILSHHFWNKVRKVKRLYEEKSYLCMENF